jgi:acetyl esterase/lipase
LPPAWRPRGIGGWLLSLIAALFLAVLAALAVAMVVPLPFDDPLGLAGLLALAFPLHLLAVALMMLVLAGISWRRRAGVAAVLFGAAALLSAASALWPAAALWRFAQADNVPLSLGDYTANAAHMNLAEPQPARTVVYGTAPDGTKLLLDAWPAAEPAGDAARPAIVRIHGGGFVQGARDDMPDWNRWLNRRGFVVFDIAYRLPPPVRWQDEIGDVKCALAWVAGHATAYRIDPDRISTLGASAGGTLALLAAYSVGDPRLPPSCAGSPVRVRSVINLYGVPDMPGLYDTSPSRDMVHSDSKRYIGGSPAEFPGRHAAVSPMTYVSAAAPPTISFLGAKDRIVPRGQLAELDAALQRAGAVSEAYLLPATDHAFDINWGGFATQFARAKIAAFLDRYR